MNYSKQSRRWEMEEHTYFIVWAITTVICWIAIYLYSKNNW